MTSSLLISHCDVPLQSAVITPSKVYAEDRPVSNLFFGGRHAYAELAATAGPLTIEFTLHDGATAEVDHLIIGGDSQILIDVVERLMLQYWDGANYADLVGWADPTPSYADAVALNPANGDKIAFCSSTAGNRFRLEIHSAGGSKFTLAKVYFGKFFDMGKDPDEYEYLQDEIVSGELRSVMGKRELGRLQHPAYRFEVHWVNVSDAKAAEFVDKILHDPVRRFVYLYTPNVHEILGNQRLVFCEVLQEECYTRSQAHNLNEVHAVFREVR